LQLNDRLHSDPAGLSPCRSLTGRERFSKQLHRCTRSAKYFCHMRVTGEHEHLSLRRLVGHEFAEHTGRGRGTIVVKIDQCIVHDNRQQDAVPLQITHQRQSQSQKNLLAGTTAEAFGVPRFAVGSVHLKAGLINCGGDVGVAAGGES
jgi:hypothetical protein